MTTKSSSRLRDNADADVPFFDLGQAYRELQAELDDAYGRVMDSGGEAIR